MEIQKRDYYEVLGVARGCDAAEIKRAYRKLAMDHHPDRNPGDHQAEERFKELAEAYQILSDPDKRQLYDQFGHAGPRQAGFQGFGGVEDILSHFADVFGGFGGFGGGGRRRSGPRVEPGEDIQAQITLSFAEAARGVTKELELTHLVRCAVCTGTGAKPGSQPTACGTCGGRGQVQHNQGIFVIAATCPSCRGRGRVVRDKCDECGGGGATRRTESVKVDVLAGIDEGQTQRVRGKGQASASGGPAGDLYVTVHVEPDPRFERDGDDLIVRVEVSYAQAALGARVRVPTVEGELDFEVPSGTQPGWVKLIRGRGLPNVHGRGVGDLAVQVLVGVPKKLSAEQRRLIEDLAKHDPEEPSSASPDGEPSGEEAGGFFFRRKKKKR